MKRLASISFFFFISLIAFCQQSTTISGKVSSNKSEGIPGASISILNTNLSAITDAAGSFVIKSVPFGEYTLQVTAVGYAATDHHITVSNDNHLLSILMETSASHLDAVVVTAQKQEELLQQVPFSISAIT